MAPRVGPSRVPRATTWADSVDSGEENRREQQQVPSASPAAHPSGACGGGGGLPSARGASPQTPAGAAAPAPQSPYKKRAEKFLRGWEYCFREQQGSSAIISTSSRKAVQSWFESHSDVRKSHPLLAIALAAWPYAGSWRRLQNPRAMRIACGSSIPHYTNQGCKISIGRI